ncbi:MAG: fumarylacetoacetate hydrolase family protein [Saprospiraceae bacterium]|nr:fumarylacetoacetate hydrolase family protein [Saprospiraceae bacterium]
MKIICIGRNYVDHAKELNNPLPEKPIIFMKPPTALLIDGRPFYYPDFTRDLHHEAEIVLKICKNGRHIEPQFAHTYYQEIGFGIDFTARDIQSELKKNGHPWEIAKAFDFSAPIGRFIPLEKIPDPKDIHFELTKNGVTVQKGSTASLIFPFDDLICYISRYFRLQIGDYIFTGTPAGVGPVSVGDVLVGSIEGEEVFSCDIR